MQRGQDACHGFRKIDADQLRRQPQHAVPEPTEVTVTPRIRGTPQFMRVIIDFHDQLGGGCDEVRDILAANRHLPPKCNAKLVARELLPKKALIVRQMVPHEVSALTELRLEFELLTGLLLHEDLRCPANQPGFAAHGAEGMPCARGSSSSSDCAWRDLCAARGARLICRARDAHAGAIVHAMGFARAFAVAKRQRHQGDVEVNQNAKRRLEATRYWVAQPRGPSSTRNPGIPWVILR